MPDHGSSSRRRTLLVGLTAALVLPVLDPAPVAKAEPATPVPEPVTPSQHQVDAAGAAATAAAAEMAELNAELADQQGAVDTSQLALSVAAEDHDEARAVLHIRAQEATAAAAAATKAEAGYETARVAVGRLASQRYRGNAVNLGPLTAMLGAGGPQEVIDRSTTLELLSEQRADAARTLAVAKMQSRTAAATAQTANERQQQATTVARTAQRKAARAAAAATALMKRTQARTEAVLARMALLEQTSLALQVQRQAGLEAERRAAGEAAARAAVDEAAGAQSATARPPSRTGPAPSRAAPPPARYAGAAAAGAPTAVSWALAQLGKPYEWAADGPDSFDCSGLTSMAWAAAGVGLPHSSRLQYSGQAKVLLADLQPGDLVFYATDPANPSTIHHVGMFLGDSLMVEAPHSGATVRRTSIYRSGLVGYGARPG